jgi:hypothetical protein
MYTCFHSYSYAYTLYGNKIIYNHSLFNQIPWYQLQVVTVTTKYNYQLVDLKHEYKMNKPFADIFILHLTLTKIASYKFLKKIAHTKQSLFDSLNMLVYTADITFLLLKQTI